MNKKFYYFLPVGTLLQEYRIEGIARRESFSITYLAYDTNVNKKVAIKEYLPAAYAVRVNGAMVQPNSAADKEGFVWGRNRFIDEARALGQFTHASINRVFRFFEENNTAYIVLEHLEGETLATLLDAGLRFNEEELLFFIRQLADGLSLVHQAGYVHRDIKPANIMICKNQQPVLLDFGAARNAIGVKTKTITSMLTPGYAPLEQYGSSTKSIGPWTDLYSLGMVLYRCVTGAKDKELPLAVVRAHALQNKTGKETFAALEALTKTYSQAILDRIEWAIQINQADRPQSTTEWLGKDIITAPPPTWNKPQPPQKKILSPRLMAWGASLIMIIFFAIVVGPLVAKKIRHFSREEVPAVNLVEIKRLFEKYNNTRLVKKPSWKTREYNLLFKSLAKEAQTTDSSSILVQYYLGLSYKLGLGVKPDLQKAYEWFEKSAVSGFAKAQSELGFQYLTGQGVLKDLSLAELWFNKAAKQEDFLGLYGLALVLLNQPAEDNKKTENSLKAISRLRFLAHLKISNQYQNKYVTQAQRTLGSIYHNKNSGVAADEAHALYWFKKSAAKGDLESVFRIARIYHTAKYSHRNKNLRIALHWYQKLLPYKALLSSEFNINQHINNIEAIIGKVRSGEQIKILLQKGGALNLSEAIQIYVEDNKDHATKKAATTTLVHYAEQGESSAQYYLGQLRKSAAQNNIAAMVQLGKKYSTGTHRNRRSAYHWYRKAAQQGDAEALTGLGELYLSEKWVNKKRIKSKKSKKWIRRNNQTRRRWINKKKTTGLAYLKKAANKEFPYAQFLLSKKYANKKKALYWREKAAVAINNTNSTPTYTRVTLYRNLGRYYLKEKHLYKSLDMYLKVKEIRLATGLAHGSSAQDFNNIVTTISTLKAQLKL